MQFHPFFLHHVNCSGEGCGGEGTFAWHSRPASHHRQQGETTSTSAMPHFTGKIAIHHQFDRYSSGKNKLQIN